MMKGKKKKTQKIFLKNKGEIKTLSDKYWENFSAADQYFKKC